MAHSIIVTLTVAAKILCVFANSQDKTTLLSTEEKQRQIIQTKNCTALAKLSYVFLMSAHTAVPKMYTIRPVQYNTNTKPICNAPISPSKKSESEAREATVTGSDQCMRCKRVRV